MKLVLSHRRHHEQLRDVISGAGLGFFSGVFAEYLTSSAAAIIVVNEERRVGDTGTVREEREGGWSQETRASCLWSIQGRALITGASKPGYGSFGY